MSIRPKAIAGAVAVLMAVSSAALEQTPKNRAGPPSNKPTVT
ncbi:hypothetical protein [Bradyrhizobium sp. WD16]|nr:hypothetical protein [Bradyrhizobium sp. WD16]